MADLLRREPSVGFFEHEVSSCMKPFGRDAHRRAMFSILAAPSCEMPCRTRLGTSRDTRAEPAWVAATATARPAPPCLAGRVVGFDVQAASSFGDRREAPLDWADDWPALLRLPGVRAVVYARSNAVKRVVSKAHVDALVQHCHGHKVVKAASRDCYQAHRAQIDAPIALDGRWLAQQAHGEGADWAALVANVRRAAGAAPFVMFYEALQRDTAREIRRLLRHVGLAAVDVAATSESTPAPRVAPRPAPTRARARRSVKITSDDLRTVLANFSRVEAELAAADECLLPQLRDTSLRVFAQICLKGGRTGRFEDPSSSDK